MKIINLIRCEFLKNYTLKNIVLTMLILLISVFGITFITEMFYADQSYNTVGEADYHQRLLDSLKQKEELSYKDEFLIFQCNSIIEMLEKMNTIENIFQRNWQYEIFFDRLEVKENIFVLKQIKENINDEYFFNIYNSSLTYYEEYEGLIRTNYSSDVGELDNKILENEKLLSEYDLLIEENKYYKYLEFVVSHEDMWEERLNAYKKVIDLKVESQSDFMALNLHQFVNMFYQSRDSIVSETEFNNNFDLLMSYPNYDGYVRYNEKLVSLYEEKQAIIKYALDNNLKHDLEFDSYMDGIDVGQKYISSKVVVNQVLNLSIVVIVVVILTSGGIVSKEHSCGTEKILLTSPVKRWKVLLSKFIYLVLHSYIVWLIALVLLMLYAGIKYGFSDLFTPKLIFENGSVIEVNYLLYLLKNILVCSIPVIAFISIMLFLSTVTLSTSLTVGISMIVAIISPISWYLICNFKLTFLAYTAVPYFDLGLIINNFEACVNSLQLIDVSVSLGVIISIITIVVLYIITNLVYVKRDIKN